MNVDIKRFKAKIEWQDMSEQERRVELLEIMDLYEHLLALARVEMPAGGHEALAKIRKRFSLK